MVPVFPVSACVLGAFIAHLHSQRYAPVTLMTYMSAISYVHRLAGKVVPTQLFVIKKLLVGAKTLSGTPDNRLPIDLSMLRNIVDATKFIASCLFATSTKHVSLRISTHREITIHSRHNDSHSIIQFLYVTICNTGIVLVIYTLSTTSDAYCPVHALSQFLLLRGTFDCPLFAFANSSPVSLTYFCQYLTKALKGAGTWMIQHDWRPRHSTSITFI